MVRDGYRKGHIYNYLAPMSLMASALLAPQLGAAEEMVNVEPGSQVVLSSSATEQYSSLLGATAPWLAASGDGSVVAGMSQLFNTAEARSRQFITDQDRQIRSELSGWFAAQSSLAIKQDNTVLNSPDGLIGPDGGLSVGVGTDELSVDWTVKF